MPSPENHFTVPREEAASLLGVSTRTLDRYLTTGRLKSKLIDRKILVHAVELARLKKRLNRKQHGKSTKKTFHRVRKERVRMQSAVSVNNDPAEKVFRELHATVSAELKVKQERLEAASFRVGQLEAQLKNSVPLLEHKKREGDLSAENAKLKERLLALTWRSWILVGGLTLAILIAIAAWAILTLPQPNVAVIQQPPQNAETVRVRPIPR